MRIIISGLEGVGKTSLCSELKRRGYEVVGEGIDEVMEWYCKVNEKNEKTTWEAIERAEDVKMIEEWLFFQKLPRIIHGYGKIFDRGLIDILFYMKEDGEYWQVYAEKYKKFLRILRRQIEPTRWIYVPVKKEFWENSKLDEKHHRRPSHQRLTYGEMLMREDAFLKLYKEFGIDPEILPGETTKERADYIEKMIKVEALQLPVWEEEGL